MMQNLAAIERALHEEQRSFLVCPALPPLIARRTWKQPASPNGARKDLRKCFLSCINRNLSACEGCLHNSCGSRRWTPDACSRNGQQKKCREPETCNSTRVLEMLS